MQSNSPNTAETLDQNPKRNEDDTSAAFCGLGFGTGAKSPGNRRGLGVFAGAAGTTKRDRAAPLRRGLGCDTAASFQAEEGSRTPERLARLAGWFYNARERIRERERWAVSLVPYFGPGPVYLCDHIVPARQAPANKMKLT